MPRRQPILTLLTDFGSSDPYVAVMKGVILSSCPTARIVDISHQIPAHDVLAGAFVLAQAAPWFPKGTVHVVVVDPTVGTDRRVLAARIGGQVILAPDNGVLSFLDERFALEDIRVVVDARYSSGGTVSATFHGRDLFAPIAARILNGLDISKLGPQPETYKHLDLPVCRSEAGALIGQVLHIDHFGNVITNIPREAILQRWENLDAVGVQCAGRRIEGFRQSYGLAEPGTLIALFNSMDLLELAVNRGRACELLGARRGTAVRVIGPTPKE